MTDIYEQLGRKLGALVDRKNRAYGSSFEKAGPFLQLLYPEGIRPHQMTDALLLVRIFDKQVRIATGADSFGESPYQDIAGYGLLGAQLHQEKACQGSANGQDAPNPPEAQPASAPQPTSAKTTTSANEPNAQPNSPSSNASCANTAEPPTSSALQPAPTASPISQSAADLLAYPCDIFALSVLALAGDRLSSAEWRFRADAALGINSASLEGIAARLFNAGFVTWTFGTTRKFAITAEGRQFLGRGLRS